MGIGAGIFLIAIGAILKFALDVNVQGIDLQTVGVILMIVGVIGIIIEAAIFMPRRRRPVDATDEFGRPVRRDRDGY
ncbi:MAG: DUF6458 family protein [Mycobacteriaceae bacterium]